MKKIVFIMSLSVLLAGGVFPATTVPQKGSMNLNLELTDPGGTDTVTDTVILKHLKASEIEPFISTRLSKYGAVQTDDALNMLIITDMQAKVNDLIKIAKKLDVAGLANFLRLETVIIPVKNLQASALVNLIREKLSREAVIKTDDNLNTLVITDVKSKIDDAMTLIKVLDVPIKQVMIEARIVELQDGADSDTGVDWRNILQSAQALAAGTLGQISFPVTAGQNGSMKNYTDRITYSDVYTKAGMSVQGLDTLIGILSRDGKARILSSPRISCSNNMRAYLNTGDQFFYSQEVKNQIPLAGNDGFSVSSNQDNNALQVNKGGNTSGYTSYNYNYNSSYYNNMPPTGTINAGVSLNVVPHIISDDTVTLDINATVSNLSGWAPNGTPIISSRSTSSTITIKNGEVFTMGGLKKDTLVKSTDRVPVLGYIPFLGFFFSSDKETKVSNDVVIFISPSIMKEQGAGMTDDDKAALEKAGKESR